MRWVLLGLGWVSGCQVWAALDEDSDTQDDSGPVEPLAPDIEVDITSIEWDTVAPGCIDARPLTIRNIGGSPLHVSGISVPASFEVAGSTLADIPAGGGHTFTVAFRPTSIGVATGSLRVHSDDPDEPNLDVAVAGVGGTPMSVDSFTQQDPGKVDVLWVVDTSASGSALRAELESQFDEYVEALRASGADFQIGLTTADMAPPDGAQGHLQGTPTVWTNAMTNQEIVQAFDSAIPASANGSATERPLAAAWAALEDPGHAVDEGLVRADARLDVVVVADEDDQSGQGSVYWTEWIDAYKPSTSDTRVNAFLPMASGGSNPFDLGECTDFMGLPILLGTVTQTGGVAVDVCTHGFSESLRTVAASASALTTRLELSNVPATGAQGIVVSSAGSTVPHDPLRTNGWYYDAAANAVVFVGTGVPEPGDEVVVTYPTESACTGRRTNDGSVSPR